MSVLDRLENIRIAEGLNKGQFEKALGKSSGYLKILNDKGGLPGADVFIKFSENFRKYDLNWVLTGEGNMEKLAKPGLANENQEEYQLEKKTTLLDVRDDIKEDLKGLREDIHALAEGSTKNQEVISNGIFQTLKDLQKVVRFVEKLDAVKITTASKGLEAFLEKQQK